MDAHKEIENVRDSHENDLSVESIPLGSLNMAAEDIVPEPERDGEDTTNNETEDTNLIWKEIQNARVLFNFDDFFYTLTMGLAPMLWDITTDFNFADWLTERKDITTAGQTSASLSSISSSQV